MTGLVNRNDENGVAMLTLKRLPDAIADGDHIAVTHLPNAVSGLKVQVSGN